MVVVFVPLSKDSNARILALANSSPGLLFTRFTQIL